MIVCAINGGSGRSSNMLLLYVMCLLAVAGFGLGSGNDTMKCIDSERHALLNFKSGLVAHFDTVNLLNSWSSGGGDCCKWHGVGCNNQTGHVVMLDLSVVITEDGDGTHAFYLSGELGPSLLDLPYLSYLDLSNNEFDRIPDFIGSLNKLTYLDLSGNSFNGIFPYHLGNLTMLKYLVLGDNFCYDMMTAHNFEWLTRLSSLRMLNISCVNFTVAVDWLHSIRMHPSLSILELSACQFPKVNPSSASRVNSSKTLAVLSLFGNQFITPSSMLSILSNISTGLASLRFVSNYEFGQLEISIPGAITYPIPDSFGDMTSLEHLDLSNSQFEGRTPISFQNLCHLKTLDLSSNILSGSCDDILQNLMCAQNSLEVLRLSGNKLKGPIPDFTEFNSLRELYLANNLLNETFPESFKNSSKLLLLNVEGNQLVGSLPNFLKFPSLMELHVANNHLNGSVSEIIGKLSDLVVLDVSSNSLNGVVSETHLSKLSNLKELDLSFNSFVFNVSSNGVPSFQLDVIGLSSCKLGPSFPSWLQSQKNYSFIDISNSGISDVAPRWFWNLPSTLLYLNLSFNHIYGQIPDVSLHFNNFPRVDLSSNLLYGPIPKFLYNTTALYLPKNMFSGSLSFLCMTTDSSLGYLDLSSNVLSGSLTDCWSKLKRLVMINLENNNLSGTIPSSLGSLDNVETLRLRNNSFTGELPWSLKNCTQLELLDLGENKLTGELPAWIGKSLTRLIVLRLRSNEFNGSIPSTMCHLNYVQILDLSFNKLSGIIPTCLKNLTAMVSYGSYNTIFHSYYGSYNRQQNGGLVITSQTYFDSAWIFWKRFEQEYQNTLGLLRVIDFSSNNLVGGIPREIADLLELISLNLSRNNLAGPIPVKIGQLKALEVLDLSYNQLSGEIPSSLANLSFLAELDLSNNQLVGRIPSGTQLQSFSASAYIGNVGLCGRPMPNDCQDGGRTKDPSNTDNNEDNGEKWFDRSCLYTGMGIGFGAGFWGICGPLIFSNSWRLAYFQFLNNMFDWLYVIIALKLARTFKAAR